MRMGKRSTGHCAVGLLAAFACSLAPASRAQEPATSAAQNRALTALFAPRRVRYDEEYPAIPYGKNPEHNAVARLQSRLDRGEVRLERHPVRGYLDSLLAAIGIDLSSQSLVFSKTSFQTSMIRAATPRAIYFNDDTYVAWTQNAELLEIGTMDAELGPVFYSLANDADGGGRFEREMENCLSCHDSFTLTGGGVPRFILGSGYVGVGGEQLTHEGNILTTDRTPLRSRWGGWYVTGRHGSQVHLGNVLVRSVSELVNLEAVRRGNLDTLDGLFDTSPYLTNRSDIVALLVFQHQMYIQNLITRVNFETRTALAREPELSPATAARLKEYLDQLADAMLFVGAAPYTERISGNSGFDRWFEGLGPKDGRGRSLRKLDLTTRLFAYPLSYLVYSAGFAALPDYAKSHVYGRFAAVLGGAEQDPLYAHLSAADRKATLEILNATLPDFTAWAKTQAGP